MADTNSEGKSFIVLPWVGFDVLGNKRRDQRALTILPGAQ